MPITIKDQNNPNVTYEIPTADELVASQAAQAIIDSANAIASQKNSIVTQLDNIDIKSIRALRTGDTVRIASLEAEASGLRVQLASL